MNVSTRAGNKPETVIIDLAVSEKPTGSLSLGAGYSTALGLGGIIEYRERNFIGRGQGLNFKIQGGSDNTTYSFGFIEPAFLGNELQFSLNLAYEETNQQNSTYDTKSVNFQPGISYPISDFSRFGLRYTYTSDIYMLHGGRITKIVFQQSIRPYMPFKDEGFLHSFKQGVKVAKPPGFFGWCCKSSVCMINNGNGR